VLDGYTKLNINEIGGLVQVDGEALEYAPRRTSKVGYREPATLQVRKESQGSIHFHMLRQLIVSSTSLEEVESSALSLLKILRTNDLSASLLKTIRKLLGCCRFERSWRHLTELSLFRDLWRQIGNLSRRFRKSLVEMKLAELRMEKA
jgi:hypothetical protein